MKLTKSQRESLVTWFTSIVSTMMSDTGNDQERVKNSLKILAGDSIADYAAYASAFELIGSDVCFVFDRSGQSIISANIRDAQAWNAKLYLRQLCKLAQATVDLNQFGDIMAKADQALPEVVADVLATAPRASALVAAGAHASLGVAEPVSVAASSRPVILSNAVSATIPNDESETRLPIKLPVLVAIREGAYAKCHEHRGRSEPYFKAVIAGNSDAGKRDFLSTMTYASDTSAYAGSDFRYGRIDTIRGSIKFQIWDTTGQERFRFISPHYYRESACIFVMVNPANHPESISGAANTWREDVQRVLPDHNWYSVLYDGYELDLAPCTPESLARASHNPVPHNLKAAGQVLLTQVSSHFNLSPEPTAAAAVRAPALMPPTATPAPAPSLLGNISAFFGMGGSGRTSVAASSASAAQPPILRR